MEHSGYCINRPEHGDFYYPVIVVDLTPLDDVNRFGIDEEESNLYRDIENRPCWICNNCTSDPQFLVENLFKLFLIRQDLNVT